MEENKELFDITRDITHEPGCYCRKCIKLKLIREREAAEEYTDYNGTPLDIEDM